jgi:hypothetical protein
VGFLPWLRSPQPADLVDHRALYSPVSEPHERHTPVGLVPVHGLDQADRASRHEVVFFNREAAPSYSTGDRAYEQKVGDDPPFAIPRASPPRMKGGHQSASDSAGLASAQQISTLDQSQRMELHRLAAATLPGSAKGEKVETPR